MFIVLINDRLIAISTFTNFSCFGQMECQIRLLVLTIKRSDIPFARSMKN